MTILIVFLSVCGAVLLYYGYTKILSAPLKNVHAQNGLKQHMTVKELGLMEGSIPNLKEVIIIADKIEEPTDELLHSVRVNFKNKVKYVFLISEQQFENAQKGYWKIFQGIAEAIKHNYQVENVLEIRKLNLDWEEYPYVFYRFEDPNTNQLKAIAYMGTQLNEGIADEYELINPTIALKMLNLAFKAATIPEHEKIKKEELYNIDPQLISQKAMMN